MARIAGVDIPSEKRVVIALTYIYGIGLSSAQKICRKCDVNPDMRVTKLSDNELTRIRSLITTDYKVIFAEEDKALRERWVNEGFDVKKLQPYQGTTLEAVEWAYKLMEQMSIEDLGKDKNVLNR